MGKFSRIYGLRSIIYYIAQLSLETVQILLRSSLAVGPTQMMTIIRIGLGSWKGLIDT